MHFFSFVRNVSFLHGRYALNYSDSFASNMKTVLLFIPHYVYTSDLLRTPFITTLAQKNRVVVLSPVFSVTDPKEYPQHRNIVYRAWDILYPRFWVWMTKHLRIGLIREFDHLNYYKLRDYAFKVWYRRLPRAISRLLPHWILSATMFMRWEKLLLPNHPAFRKLLAEYNPSLIITSSPGFSSFEAEVIILAKKNRIPTAAINFSWDNLTTNAQQMRRSDYLVVWNYLVKGEAQKLHHYPEENVFVSGTIRFDHHFAVHAHQKSREEFLRLKGLNPALKTILFTGVPQHIYPYQAETIEDLLRGMEEKKIPPMNILIRIHPREVVDPFLPFAKLPNVHLEIPGHLKQKYSPTEPHKIEMDASDYENLRDSLRFSDVGINYRSSVTLEFFIYDKPIINISYHNMRKNYTQDHYLPILNSRAIRLAENRDELFAAVNEYLARPETDSDERRRLRDLFIPFRDGRSYERNVEAINAILDRVSNNGR